jgi:protein O-mannosyl-transferase
MKKREAAKPAPHKDRRNLLVILALVAASLLCYSNSFTSGFVFDNKGIILQDPRIQADTSQNISDIFNHTYWWPTGESGLYRPLTTLSYFFNYTILGDRDQPADYHLVNLLLHVTNAVLIYFLILRLTGNFRVSVVSAGIWSVHPLLTESVTNVIGRADLLSSLALLGGLLIYQKIADSAGWKRVAYLLALAVLTGVGVFCKESAIMIVGLIALYELTWWKERRLYRTLLVPAAVALFIPIEFFLYRRSIVLSSSLPADFPFFDNPIVGADFWTGRLSALKVLARYLRLIVWPDRLSADYSYNQIPLASGTAGDWFACIVIALAAAGVLWSFRKSRTVFFLGCFAFLTILPASNLLFPAGTMMAERLAYLPSAAVLACVVMGVYALAARFHLERRVPLVFGLLACALAARTWVRNNDWQDDMSFARATVASSPNSFKSHQILAETLFLQDSQHRDIDGVIAEAERGLAVLDPLPEQRSSPELYRLAGACYLLKGDRLRSDAKGPAPAGSVEQYRRALIVLQRGAAIVKAQRSLRSAKLKALGRPDTQFAPSSNDDVFRLLSVAYLRMGNGDASFETAAEGRKQDPLNPEAYSQMAEVLKSVGDNYQAATVLMQGMLVTSDLELRKQLIDLYGQGLDQQHCAVTNGPNGPAINPSCALVRKQLCEVSADTVSIALFAGKTNTAHSLKNSFVRDYGCPADPLNRILPQ